MCLHVLQDDGIDEYLLAILLFQLETIAVVHAQDRLPEDLQQDVGATLQDIQDAATAAAHQADSVHVPADMGSGTKSSRPPSASRRPRQNATATAGDTTPLAGVHTAADRALSSSGHRAVLPRGDSAGSLHPGPSLPDDSQSPTGADTTQGTPPEGDRSTRKSRRGTPAWQEAIGAVQPRTDVTGNSSSVSKSISKTSRGTPAPADVVQSQTDIREDSRSTSKMRRGTPAREATAAMQSQSDVTDNSKSASKPRRSTPVQHEASTVQSQMGTTRQSPSTVLATAPVTPASTSKTAYAPEERADMRTPEAMSAVSAKSHHGRRSSANPQAPIGTRADTNSAPQASHSNADGSPPGSIAWDQLHELLCSRNNRTVQLGQAWLFKALTAAAAKHLAAVSDSLGHRLSAALADRMGSSPIDRTPADMHASGLQPGTALLPPVPSLGSQGTPPTTSALAALGLLDARNIQTPGIQYQVKLQKLLEQLLSSNKIHSKTCLSFTQVVQRLVVVIEHSCKGIQGTGHGNRHPDQAPLRPLSDPANPDNPANPENSANPAKDDQLGLRSAQTLLSSPFSAKQQQQRPQV